MSKSEILYVKGTNMSESEGDEDIWDDSKLNAAYDKALKMANVKVAKRLAMATNSQSQDDKEDQSKSRKDKTGSNGLKTPHKKEATLNWMPGVACRAVYEGDGIEYEAIVVSVISDKECAVKFLGYNNTEIVPISTLKQSLGKEAQAFQIEQALHEQSDDEFASQGNENRMDCGSDRVPSPGSTEKSFRKKKSSKKKSSKHSNTFDLPEMPSMMPNFTMLRNGMNLGAMDMPMPPPPSTGLPSLGRLETEDQALSCMLLSWYMNGYYTGLYQGLKRAKENRKNE